VDAIHNDGDEASSVESCDGEPTNEATSGLVDPKMFVDDRKMKKKCHLMNMNPNL